MSEPTRSRRSEQREVARKAMLESAIGLLAANGYSGMKLADVSRVSGYSYGLAPFYFESKAGLMLAIQEEIDATFTEYMASACDPESSGRQFVDQWVTGMFGFAKEHPSHWRASVVILVESVVSVRHVADEHAQFVARNVRTLQAAFQRGIADGSIPATVDAHSAALTVEALVKGVNLDWFGDPTVDLDDRCRLVLDIVRRLVGS